MNLIYPPGKRLYPFQKTAIRQMLKFMMSNETCSTYNCCEQGLGKTIQTIVALNSIFAYRTLVLCPAIMRLVWEEEINSWAVPYTAKEVLSHVILSGRDILPIEELKLYDYIICSYDLARTKPILDVLSKLDYDAIVCDEAHYLNNTRAKRTKAVFKTLWDRGKYHILCSGTPFTTSVVNGYSCFHKILPSAFPDFPTFTSNFCYERVTPWGKEYFGIKNAEILSKIIRKSFYIRYTKQEVLPDLPDKIYQRIILPIQYAVLPKGNNEKEELEAEMEMVRRAIEKGSPPPIPANLAEHRRLQGEAKVPAVCEFVTNLLEQEIPVVLFGWHRNVITMLVEGLKKYKPAVITGDTSATKRSEAVKAFQNGETNLICLNIQAGGVGITLTRSSTCVYAENTWSPSDLAQSSDRLHRIGQKDVVQVYYFIVQCSLDESIMRVVLTRAKQFKQVLE